MCTRLSRQSVCTIKKKEKLLRYWAVTTLLFTICIYSSIVKYQVYFSKASHIINKYNWCLRCQPTIRKTYIIRLLYSYIYNINQVVNWQCYTRQEYTIKHYTEALLKGKQILPPTRDYNMHYIRQCDIPLDRVLPPRESCSPFIYVPHIVINLNTLHAAIGFTIHTKLFSFSKFSKYYKFLNQY